MRILIRVAAGLSPSLAPLARGRFELASLWRLIVIEDTDAEAAVAIGRAADLGARVVARAVQTLTNWRPIDKI